MHTLVQRPRRNRQEPSIRALIQETHLTAAQLVAPLFVVEGSQQRQSIHSLPEVERLSIDLLCEEARILSDLGICAVDLFAYIPREKRSPQGEEAYVEGNLLQKAIYALKKATPSLCVMVDIALDPYTDHGHDGVVDEKGTILNDETVNILAKMAVGAARAGADIIAPSDMMDGRIAALRYALDQAGFSHIAILSYAAKYASALYGPFREALDSAPRFGDKKSYQLNYTNRREAIRDALLDVTEGADMLLVKPALPYLDVLYELRQKSCLPLAAYHVSGEYAMVLAAAAQGWIDADAVFLEQLISIRRAGADFILTYAAKRIAKQL